MAVNLTAAQLAVQLRVIVSDTEYDALPQGQRDVISRHLETSTALVEKYAPAAPVSAQNEAVVRISGFLFDRSGSENRGVNPILASGAAYLLSSWRTRSLAVPDGWI